MKKYYLFLTLILSTTSFCQTAGSGLTDIDGNNYNSVIIGTQEWQKENLNVSKYTDGTVIPQVNSASDWVSLTTGAWCYYTNNATNGPIYGKLYNWYAVAGIYDAASAANPALRKKLAPTGWHVPSDAEWIILSNWLDPTSNGGNTIPNIVGGKMKATGTSLWLSPNTGATNESGFTALPGGSRFYNGTFDFIGNGCAWWSSSQVISSNFYAWYRFLNYGDSNIYINNNMTRYGYSVRCIKNNALSTNLQTINEFIIYPNPAKDKITIDFGSQTNTSGWSYKIVNMLGQEVITDIITSQQSIVPLDSLSGKGMYFVKIYDNANDLQETKKIIVN